MQGWGAGDNKEVVRVNLKQEMFALEYVIDLNATQAAIRAGYSEKTAYSTGQRLLKNVEIQEHIKKSLEERKSALIADSTEVLETLTRVLRREEQETVVLTVKERRSYYDSNGKKIIEEKEVPELVEIPTKVSDVNNVADKLGRYYSLFTDKIELKGSINNPFEELTTEQLMKLVGEEDEEY